SCGGKVQWAGVPASSILMEPPETSPPTEVVMKRCLLSLLLLVALVPLAQGHFIWIVPEKDGTTAKVIFSDSLEPDAPALLDKIAKTEVYVGTGEKMTLAKWTKGKDAYVVTVPGKEKYVAALCQYGVIEKGKGDPFLLVYGATAALSGPFASGEHASPLPLEV